MKALFLALSIIALSASAQAAGIHKCKDASGNITYSQTPCSGEGSQLDIQTQPGQQMDAATAAEISRQRVESMNRATNMLKGPEKPPRWAVEKPKPTTISHGDRMRLADIARSIQIRQETRINVEGAQREIRALRQERREIYAKYGLNSAGKPLSQETDDFRETAERQPRFPHPVTTTDGRVVIPNDPDGNTFHSDRGDYLIRQGNQLWNPRTGERINLP